MAAVMTQPLVQPDARPVPARTRSRHLALVPPAPPGERAHRSGSPLTCSRRASSTTYWRRRVAVTLLALGLVAGAVRATAALGSSPLVAPERPASVQRTVVAPGDSLWTVAQRLAPGVDPRPVVDELEAARGDAPLLPGEEIAWPAPD